MASVHGPVGVTVIQILIGRINDMLMAMASRVAEVDSQVEW